MSLQEYAQEWKTIGQTPKPKEPTVQVSETAIDAASPEPAVAENGDPPPPTSTDIADDNGNEEKDENEKADGKDSDDPLEEEPLHSAVPKIMDIVEMKTRNGVSVTTKARRFRKPKTGRNKFDDYSCILRRELDEMGQPVKVNLEVRSRFLRETLKTILAGFERLNLESSVITLPKPYEPLFHRQKEIKAARAKTQDPQCQQELDLLIEFMDLNLEETRKQHARHVPHGKITADIAWTLFPPGEIVVLNNKNSHVPAQCFKVHDCFWAKNGMIIKSSIWAWNGRKFGSLRKQILLPVPENGVTPITELNAYPLKYHPQLEEFKKNMIKRGRTYSKIVRRAHMTYNGVVWTQDPIDEELIQVHVNGRVMIDYGMFVRNSPPAAVALEGDFGPDISEDTEMCFCGVPDCTYESSKKKKEPEKGKEKTKAVEPFEEKELAEDEALLCPGFVQGFALQDKIWAEFRIDRLKEIEWNTEAYQRLEMDEGTKAVLQALVDSHRKHSAADTPEFDDIIAGKGLGLVFLLQGPPGLGKTLTAESVAEQSKKPLYTISSGELGTTVSDMETALAKAFRIAKEWNTILLLDEADVFMSKRSADNLEKNAFVSVFLRLMEYYQGILFLTTNRASDFDPAFLSRIHLIIDYKPLDLERRARIWKNLASNMKKDDSLNDEGFKALAKDFDINGREIKNMLRTAWSLAKHANVPLNLEHVKTVARIRSRA